MYNEKERIVAVEWCVDDVLSERPDLTEDQAWHVLETAYFEHDANDGINWNILSYWAEYLYPQEEAA